MSTVTAPGGPSHIWLHRRDPRQGELGGIEVPAAGTAHLAVFSPSGLATAE